MRRARGRNAPPCSPRGLVPLAVVLWRRAKAGAWGELPASLFNGDGSRPWRPRPPGSRPASSWPRAGSISSSARCPGWASPVLPPGSRGLPCKPTCRPLALDRAGAEAAADAALKARGVTLGPEWRRFSAVRRASEEPQWTQHKFVWREAGAEAYRALIGATLAPPLWDVRYATFEGDVAARAEEWRITIEPDGGVRQIRHVLPEARPGRAPAQGRRARAGEAASARALRIGSRCADARRGRGEGSARAHRLVVRVRGSPHRRGQGRRGAHQRDARRRRDRRHRPFRPRAGGVAARRARAIGPPAERKDRRRAAVRARRARRAGLRREELAARPLRRPCARGRARDRGRCARPAASP